MTAAGESLTIGQLAQAAGVSVETIRFYQRKRLLAVPPRPPGGIRRYGPRAAARVEFIKAAQRLGFSLGEVAELLRLEDGMQCAAAAELASHHLADVRLRLQHLQHIEAALAGLLQRCASHTGNVACPLIKALHAHERQACQHKARHHRSFNRC